MRKLKQKIVRKIFNQFYRKIIQLDEEWMHGHPTALGLGSRKVDVVLLECNHKYWREQSSRVRTRIGDRSIILAEHMPIADNSGILCDACLKNWLETQFGWEWGGRVFGWWDKIFKKVILL